MYFDLSDFMILEEVMPISVLNYSTVSTSTHYDGKQN
jgi:hypothetical protein